MDLKQLFEDKLNTASTQTLEESIELPKQALIAIDKRFDDSISHPAVKDYSLHVSNKGRIYMLWKDDDADEYCVNELEVKGFGAAPDFSSERKAPCVAYISGH